MQKTDNPHFKTLIIVPARWNHAKAVNSPTTTFVTWDQVSSLAGRRFDQIAAMYPPTNGAESEAWKIATSRLAPGGTAFWM